MTADSPTGSDAVDLNSFVPLLQAFKLEFVDGDRPLRRVAVGALTDGLGGDPQFWLELQDGDGGERTLGSARYLQWSSGRSRSYFGLPEESRHGLQRFVPARECRGSCDLPLTDVTADDVVIITGFRFTYPDGENNLFGIGLERRGEGGGVLRATFQDNDGAERFIVEASYIVFPENWSDQSAITGGSVLDGSSFEDPLNEIWLERLPLLGGFFLAYAYDDEHLLMLEVDATSERIRTMLRDDDAIEKVNLRVLFYAFCKAPSNDNVHIQPCES